jgi:hypothetical protein
LPDLLTELSLAPTEKSSLMNVNSNEFGKEIPGLDPRLKNTRENLPSTIEDCEYHFKTDKIKELER